MEDKLIKMINNEISHWNEYDPDEIENAYNEGVVKGLEIVKIFIKDIKNNKPTQAAEGLKLGDMNIEFGKKE